MHYLESGNRGLRDLAEKTASREYPRAATTPARGIEPTSGMVPTQQGRRVSFKIFPVLSESLEAWRTRTFQKHLLKRQRAMHQIRGNDPATTGAKETPHGSTTCKQIADGTPRKTGAFGCKQDLFEQLDLVSEPAQLQSSQSNRSSLTRRFESPCPECIKY